MGLFVRIWEAINKEKRPYLYIKKLYDW